MSAVLPSMRSLRSPTLWLVAPLLLTGTMAYFTADGAPVHFPGAAFVVAAIFGLLAILMLRRLPRATRTRDDDAADQMPPSVTA